MEEGVRNLDTEPFQKRKLNYGDIKKRRNATAEDQRRRKAEMENLRDHNTILHDERPASTARPPSPRFRIHIF